MNSEDFNKWKSDILGDILTALAASEKLKEILVYKGARILNILLDTKRMSLDIDSNLIQDFVIKFPEKEAQKEYLEKVFSAAINRYFNRQNPVRFKLETLKIQKSPPKDHPLGWNGFSVKMNVKDSIYNVRGLPSLTIDVAAWEKLSENSIAEIDLGGYKIKAYTLERITGEKLRAFLSTLPAYRNKVNKPGEALRVKDLYDIVRIHRVKPIIDNELFWELTGGEFKLACESRFIDCQGVETFQENWKITEEHYEADQTLPKDVKFDEVERMISTINDFFTLKGITPFSFRLPIVKAMREQSIILTSFYLYNKHIDYENNILFSL